MPDALPPGDAPTLLCTGTPSEIVALAPVYRALRAAGERVCVLHTGQDEATAWPLYRFFAMRPECEVVLMQPPGRLAHLAGELLARVGEVLEYVRPRAVLVHGDSLGALAGAAAASFAGMAAGHVEAGMRPRAPRLTARNRELIARVAAVHFAPSAQARANLLREGIDESAVVVTGSTVVDAIRLAANRLQAGGDLVDADVQDFIAAHAGFRIVLVAAHGHTSAGAGSENLAGAIARLMHEHADIAVVWPVEEKTLVARAVAAHLARLDPFSSTRLLVTAPMEFPTLIATLKASWVALADSGTLQEEAVAMGVPILVCGAANPRPDIVAAGYARRAGDDVDSIGRTFDALTFDRVGHAAMRCRADANPFGDGRAAERICEALLQTA
ncbi:MAG TPA: UDP-N-acetylglucosamine 2-epimerase (non-hydrolyzing) [Burkholderiaceae bacterium]|nr:UDP-N-acetylglucosamine 2-epimerase (non-hydrolyzing) [Burkholderiaceae bacterium]